MSKLTKRESEIAENFRLAKNKRQQKDGVWMELDAFDRNDQWNLMQTPSWIPKPVTNFIHMVKYVKRSAFAVDNPTGKLRPLSPMGVDQVKKLNRAYEDAFERLKIRKNVRDAIETMKLLGTAIIYMYWDESKEGRMGSTIQGDEGFMYTGEIKTMNIDPASFYPDPNAFTLEDCDYIIIRQRKPLSWIKANPKFKNTDEKNSGESFFGSDQTDRGEIYQRDYTTEKADNLVDFVMYFEREANAEGGYSYYVSYLANNKILKDKEPLVPNRYPFAVGYDFKQRQDFWGMSTCQFILDNQKMINKIESIIAMLGVLYQNPQRVVTKDSGIDPRTVSRFGNAPAQTWVTNGGDASRAIHFIQPPNIPTVLFQMLEQAKQNIREITGITESYMGQNVGSLQTSSGVQALIDRSTMRDRDQMYDIELLVEDLSKLLIDFMCTYYEEERLIRTMNPETREYEFESFTGVEFKDLEYDMIVDVSSKAPITRMREMSEAKELLNLQGQYGANYPTMIIKPQEAIEMMNLTKGQDIINRMNLEEMQNKTQEAMQVAQMMVEAIQNGVQPDEVLQMGTAMYEQMANPEQAGQTGMPNSINPQNAPQGA